MLSVAAGVPEWWCILVLGAAMILYTEEGGVTATIWTDTIQMFVYLAGALVCLVAVIQLLPDGVAAALRDAAAAGKLRVIDLSFDPTQPFTLWAGVIGGAFLTLATHGTDHYLVQRLLVARSRRDAAIGLDALRLPGARAVRAVPVPGHLFCATTAAVRSPAATRCCPRSCRTELAGAADRIHPGRHRGRRALAVAQLDGLRHGARLLPALLPPGRRRAQQLRVGRLFTVVWGVAADRRSPCSPRTSTPRSRPGSRP